MKENEAILEIRTMQKFNYTLADDEVFDMAIQALEEIQQYRAIGTIEELQDLKSRLQNYKNKMSIYAEQHKVILASDVLEALEELEW